MRTIIFFVAVIFISKSIHAQNADNIDSVSFGNKKVISKNLIPEFLNRPSYIDFEKDSLIDLEYPKSYRSQRVKFGKSGYFTTVAHSHSTVRIKKTGILNFIVRLESGTDPRVRFELLAFTIKKDCREIQLSEMNHWKNTVTTIYTKIDYQIKKVSEGVYVLIISNLNAGEYFFGTTEEVYAFGIDE
jgi:hypothetical protein